MRILGFIAKGQNLRKNPESDFSGIVKGTKGYLKASFLFGEGWEDCGKIAVFTVGKEKEYPVEIENDECEIPEDVLKDGMFSLYTVGIKEGYRICTNKVRVLQYE